MVLKSLLCTCLLLGCFAFWLSVKSSTNQAGQNQWQDNVIKAQNYIYAENQNNLKVIVGSSLSSRLVMDSLPGNYCNLAFGGQSLFDGLRIIEKVDSKPLVVYIETNFLANESDDKFIEALFVPVVSSIKKKINFLQEKNQPITFVGNNFSSTFGTRVLDPFAGRLFNPIVNKFRFDKKKEVENKGYLYSSLVKRHLNDFSSSFPESELRSKLANLKGVVSKLLINGTDVVFFEMPMDKVLENTNRLIIFRKLLKEYFPENTFAYIPKPVYADYETTDGLHLSYQEALKFTNYFKGFVK
jgi:hypothetical protein